jgi:altronate dehydratase large subunit
MTQLTGYLRSDGRKGIRNLVAVAYLVECAHHVARQIVAPTPEDAHVIGFPGCFPNPYAQTMMERLCTHPNVGAVVLVSLGCESFNRYQLEKVISDSGRPVQTLVIQRDGGTRSTIAQGRAFVAEAIESLAARSARADGRVGPGDWHSLRRLRWHVRYFRQSGGGACF